MYFLLLISGREGNTHITYHVERRLFLLLPWSVSLSPVYNDFNHVAFQPIARHNFICCCSFSSTEQTARLNAISKHPATQPLLSQSWIHVGAKCYLSENGPDFRNSTGRTFPLGFITKRTFLEFSSWRAFANICSASYI